MLKKLSEELEKWQSLRLDSSIYNIKRHKSFKGHAMNMSAENKDGEMMIRLYNQYFGNAVIQTYFSKYDAVMTQIVFEKHILPKWYLNKWVNIESLTNCHQSEYLSESITVKFHEHFHTVTIYSVSDGLSFNKHDVNIDLIKRNRNLNRKIILNFKNSTLREWESLDIKHLTDYFSILLLPESILK